MKSAIAGYAGAFFSFVAWDLAWLGLMVPRFYRPTLGDIASSGINLPPAILFYVLYPIGLFIFAVGPALKSGSPGTALVYGALFGFFTYATYDLTNHATLRNWTVSLTVVDVAWGTCLAGAAAVAGFWAASKFATA
jgi:uncharacterized membrane protein